MALFHLGCAKQKKAEKLEKINRLDGSNTFHFCEPEWQYFIQPGGAFKMGYECIRQCLSEFPDASPLPCILRLTASLLVELGRVISESAF